MRGSTSEDERKRQPIHINIPTSPPCSAAAARTTQITRPPRAGVRAVQASPIAIRAGEGSHGAERRAKRRRARKHFTSAHADKQSTSGRAHADRAPREHRAASVREHVFSSLVAVEDT